MRIQEKQTFNRIFLMSFESRRLSGLLLIAEMLCKLSEGTKLTLNNKSCCISIFLFSVPQNTPVSASPAESPTREESGFFLIM